MEAITKWKNWENMEAWNKLIEIYWTNKGGSEND